MGAIELMRVPSFLKEALRDGTVHRWYRRTNAHRAVRKWEQTGRVIPPPPDFKQQLVRMKARQFGTKILVETGTSQGDMIFATLGTFDTIYSIELGKESFAAARLRFARHRKVRLRQGNSASELSRILEELQEPTLFWLDAHYSGDGTARADVDTPISEELSAIAKHPVDGHVILIDDARLFDGTHNYPSRDAVFRLATRFWPGHECTLEHDIFVITPEQFA